VSAKKKGGELPPRHLLVFQAPKDTKAGRGNEKEEPEKKGSVSGKRPGKAGCAVEEGGGRSQESPTIFLEPRGQSVRKKMQGGYRKKEHRRLICKGYRKRDLRHSNFSFAVRCQTTMRGETTWGILRAARSRAKKAQGRRSALISGIISFVTGSPREGKKDDSIWKKKKFG